jgi:hypothetical protein
MAPGWGGGAGGGAKTKQQHLFLHSVTQIQLPANKLFCVVLSSRGIITAETFCILVMHKILSKVFSFIPVTNICLCYRIYYNPFIQKYFLLTYLFSQSVFVTWYITSILYLTILVLWINNHDSENIKLCILFDLGVRRLQY